MPDIRAITLDLDDTLWPVAPVIHRAERELWSWLDANYPAIGERFSREQVAALRKQVVREQWHMLHDFRFLRKAVLSRMAAEAGYSSDLVDDAFAVFDRARNQVELFPDVELQLTGLAKRCPIVALTNGNANLQTIGLRHLFHDVVTAADVGVAKPAPSIFSAAVCRAGVAAAEVLHVGDDPEVDVAGAARAGLRTAWMNRDSVAWPKHLPPPDTTVADVAGINRYLDAMSASNP
ncbi:MAG: HAD family hydrolase [Pseudomonadota bacterium]